LESKRFLGVDYLVEATALDIEMMADKTKMEEEILSLRAEVNALRNSLNMKDQIIANLLNGNNSQYPLPAPFVVYRNI
jgi:hypothetical protein